MPSFAAVVGGTSKFDEAAREVMAAEKNNRGKKRSDASTSPAKVADASQMASPRKAPAPVPVLQEDFCPLLVPCTQP